MVGLVGFVCPDPPGVKVTVAVGVRVMVAVVPGGSVVVGVTVIVRVVAPLGGSVSVFIPGVGVIVCDIATVGLGVPSVGDAATLMIGSGVFVCGVPDVVGVSEPSATGIGVRVGYGTGSPGKINGKEKINAEMPNRPMPRKRKSSGLSGLFGCGRVMG